MAERRDLSHFVHHLDGGLARGQHDAPGLGPRGVRVRIDEVLDLKEEGAAESVQGRLLGAQLVTTTEERPPPPGGLPRRSPEPILGIPAPKC